MDINFKKMILNNIDEEMDKIGEVCTYMEQIDCWYSARTLLYVLRQAEYIDEETFLIIHSLINKIAEQNGLMDIK